MGAYAALRDQEAVGRHVGGEVDRGLHVASQRSEVAVVDADQQRLQPESAVQLAAVDLSRLAGLSGVTAIGAVVTPDWEPADYEDLNRLAASRLLPLIAVADLVAYRLARKALGR